MIRRYYAYNITIQLMDKQKFSCGIVTTKSWLPKPIHAFREAMKLAHNVCDCDDSQIQTTYFARV